MNENVVVIGAGPAGIGVALKLGSEAMVLERRKDIGGISGTIEIEGAYFDLGGHSFHTPHPEVRELVYQSVEMFEQKRQAKCFVDGQMIEYPFQKNFRQIQNSKIVNECSEGLNQVASEAAPHYEDFIRMKFGPGISNHFMMPYNQKLWGRDLKRLSANWTGERVAAPEGVKESFKTSGGERKPLQSDTVVAYPAKGGFGEIFVALGKRIEKIRFNTGVLKIDHKNKKVLTSDNEWISYKRLVSTMPLNELLGSLSDCPESINSHLSELDHLSLKVALIVINHPVDTEIQRVYAASPHIAAHKTAVNHNSSDFLRKTPRHGIMAEVSYSPDKPLPRSDVDRWVVENLIEMKIIKSSDEVYRTQVIDMPYAYPVPTHKRSESVAAIKNWLEENSIFTVGRFGEWAYINSDEVLHRSLALGDRLTKL